MLTNAETALLGLLAEGPAHAWRLQKEIECRGMRTWTDLSQSTIYKQLRALEAAGNVETSDEIAEGRLRKVYAITEAGRTALAESLVSLLGEPEFPNQRIDIATYNIDRAPRDEVLAALATYRAELVKTIEWWRQLEDYLSESCPLHRRAVARRTRMMQEGELAWLDEFTAELGAE